MKVFLFRLKKTRIVQQALADSIFLVLYKLSLDYVYLKAVSSYYDYAGMVQKFSWYKYLLSTVLFFFMVRPIVRLYKSQKPSSSIILLLNLLYFIPGCTFYSLSDTSDAYFLFFMLYWFLLMIWQTHLFLPELKRFDYKSKELIFYLILTVVIIASVLITGIYNGFRFHFSLKDVYDLRYAQRDLNLPTIVLYMQPIASTLAPILMVYAFVRKRLVWGLILILIQLLLFSFGGMKNTLFTLIVGVLAFLFYNENRVRLLAPGLISLNIVALLEVLVNNFSYMSSYVLYRVLFIPNLLSSQFYDFFRDNELLFWRDSILGKLGLDSPYPYSTPNLIARIYYSDPTGNANNGLCGDSFSNFGWFSLLIFPFLIVFLCKMVDICAKELDSRIIILVSIIFANGFINGSLFGLLLTNGFLFAYLLLYFMPVKKVSIGNH